MQKKLPKRGKRVLVLRFCDKNGYGPHFLGDFKWPKSGYVEAPDWEDDGECGHGLHGFLNGHGELYLELGLLAQDETSKWIVVEVLKSDIRNLDGKVKFRRGNVIHYGSKSKAISILKKAGARPWFGEVRRGKKTARAGCLGTAISGKGGHSVAGSFGTAITGPGGTCNVGEHGIIKFRTKSGKEKTFSVENGDILPGRRYKLYRGRPEEVFW